MDAARCDELRRQKNVPRQYKTFIININQHTRRYNDYYNIINIEISLVNYCGIRTRTRNDRLARLRNDAARTTPGTSTPTVTTKELPRDAMRLYLYDQFLSTLFRRINLPRSPPPTTCTINIDMPITHDVLSNLYRRRCMPYYRSFSTIIMLYYNIIIIECAV